MSRNYSEKQKDQPLANHECVGPVCFDFLLVQALRPLSQCNFQLAFFTGEETAISFIQPLAISLAIVIASLSTRQFWVEAAFLRCTLDIEHWVQFFPPIRSKRDVERHRR